MKKDEPWFFQERAFAFAALVLTSNDDVKVESYVGRDINIELLAEILRNGKPTKRFFGAELVGYMDLPTIENADEGVLGPHLARGDRFEDELPLCVFVVGVRRLEGLYRWVVEPVVENGRAFLEGHAPTCSDVKKMWQKLDDAGARRLIAQVNVYYDAVPGGASPQRRRRVSKASTSTT